MSFAPKTLIAFLKRELAYISEEGPVTAVRLFHVADVDTRAPLCEKPVSNETVAEELAQELTDICQQHVDTFLSSNQEKYGVETWVGASSSVRGHITWLLTCNNPNKVALESTDPPTEKGYVAMLQRQNTTLFQMIQNFVQPMLNGHIQMTEAQNKSIELQTNLMRERENLINEGFERDLKRLKLTREFEKEDAPKPRNILGEKLLEMGIPMLMGQIGKSFPGMKNIMNGEQPAEAPSDSQPVTQNSKPETSSDLLELLDVVGEEGAINMAKASGDPMIEAFLLDAIKKHFHKEAPSSQQSAVSSEQTESAIGHRPSANNQQGGHDGQSKEEASKETSFQGSSKAEQGSSQEDASGPRKVSARTSAAKKVSRVIRPAQHTSKKASPKGRKEAHGKESRKVNGKTNGQASSKDVRKKDHGRSKNRSSAHP